MAAGRFVREVFKRPRLPRIGIGRTAIRSPRIRSPRSVARRGGSATRRRGR